MSKILKRTAIAAILVIILIISVASVAMAAGPNPNPGTCPNPEANDGTCPNPDCPNICPNPDCPNDGAQLRTQQRDGTQTASGIRQQKRDRSCLVE